MGRPLSRLRRDPFAYALIAVPGSAGLALVHGPAAAVFLTASIGIVPLAEWIRRATQHIADAAGPALGGLMNVTFGNVAELVLALFVLRAGSTEVVKGQIVGSMIGNGLLGLGLAIVAGSLRRERQTFKRERASLISSLLMLTAFALLLPALFAGAQRHAVAAGTSVLAERLSLGVAGVLIIVYGANLAYTLLTHRDVFAFGDGEPVNETPWPLTGAFTVLIGATAGIALESQLVSGAFAETAAHAGISTLFLGVTVLALVGNAAEYVSAVSFARQDRLDLSLTITIGSTVQVALLTAPLLVVISYIIGHPMNLVFRNPLELLAIAGTAFIVNAIAADGETTWFEGVLLIAVYGLLGLAFFLFQPTA